MDTAPPAFTSVPGNVDVPQDSPNGATLSLGTAAAADNCTATVTGTLNGGPIPTVFPIGTHTVLWIAADSSGNTATATTTVIVRNLPPVARAKNVTVPAGADGKANASVNDGSYDPFGDPITFEQIPLGPYAVGQTLVTLKVTDTVGTFGDVAWFADLVILATLGMANESVLRSAGAEKFRGKIVIDTTNHVHGMGPLRSADKYVEPCFQAASQVTA
ncbi:MAG: HYR domain-containing protein [Acidobacteria bacterium]|nr:HYR domain-containing protein [Acidobacteriota bacterium]